MRIKHNIQQVDANEPHGHLPSNLRSGLVRGGAHEHNGISAREIFQICRTALRKLSLKVSDCFASEVVW